MPVPRLPHRFIYGLRPAQATPCRFTLLTVTVGRLLGRFDLRGLLYVVTVWTTLLPYCRSHTYADCGWIYYTFAAFRYLQQTRLTDITDTL